MKHHYKFVSMQLVTSTRLIKAKESTVVLEDKVNGAKETYTLPEGFRILQKNGYDLAEIAALITQNCRNPNIAPTAAIVNNIIRGPQKAERSRQRRPLSIRNAPSLSGLKI